MKVNNKYQYLKAVLISFMVILALCLPSLPIEAAGTATVSVTVPAQPVCPGTQFTVNITVQPNSAIAGAQFNLTFNPTLMTVVSVVEGNLLNQGGVSTYFSPGTINNTSGAITGVAGAITSPGQTVSAAGTLAVITMTAGTARGTSNLILSNAIVGDINGQPLTVSLSNGQVSVDQAPVLGAIGNRAVNVTSALSFILSATDADGDTLTYSASGLPAGSSFNATTRVFAWTPSLGQVGAFNNIHFEVADGLAADFENISITVNKLTPVFSNLSAPSINYGATPTSLGGTLRAGSLIPTGSVAITLNGVTQNAAIDASGNFISSFVTSGLTSAASPYIINYVYTGDGNFYNTSDASKTLNINKLAATVTLGNLSQIYDGTAKSVTATTNPAGLSVVVTYNGSSTIPTAAGSYAVVATINNANYNGSASGTLTVVKVSPAFSNLSAPSINYGATPTSLGGTLRAGSLIPTGSVAITLNGVTQNAAIDASGNFISSFVTSGLTTAASPYIINYVYAGNANFNSVSDASKTLIVNKMAATVTLGNLSQIYDGTAKSVTATTNPAGLSVVVTYNGSSNVPTAAGSYAVVATINNANYNGSASGTLTVIKVSPVFSNLSAPSINYGATPTSLGGTLKSGSLIPTGSVAITLNGVTQNAAIDASGNFISSFVTSGLTTAASPYIINYVYAGNANFNSVSDASKTLIVNKMAATVTLGNLSQIYDGTAKSVTATTNPAGLSVVVTYNGSSNVPTAAGSYAVIATINNANYNGSASGTLTVIKVSPVFSNLSAPSINYGATPTSLGGTLKSGSLIPTGSVAITLNGVTQNAAIDASGNFASSFVTSGLTTGASPYTISYVYAGNANFNSASDASKTLTVIQPFAAWDANMDRSVNVLDMISVSQHVGELGAAGWIRQDINADGKVDVLDLIIIGQHWTG